jgi:hypothetical protein
MQIQVIQRDPGASDDDTLGFHNGDLAFNIANGRIWYRNAGAWMLFGTAVSPNIAAADPAIAGDLYSDAGAVTISSGP